MEVKIRDYVESDKGGCLLAFKSNVPLYFAETEVSDFDLFLDGIVRQESAKNTHYFVVSYQGKIIGCGGFGFYNATSDISLAWGLIHSDFHKKGLGEKLLSHRLEQIAIHYPSELVLLDTTQHSYSFFEKYGFVTKKITPDFYTLGLHRYDMVWEKLNRLSSPSTSGDSFPGHQF